MEERKNERIYTMDDIYQLPQGQRAELIDGRIYEMALPNWTHQRLVSKINQAIHNYMDSHQENCQVLPAPFSVFLNQEETTYVEPDLSIICDEKKLDEKGCHGAPDWIIEIASPSSRRMDYFRKLFSYQQAGVREYWIVDPMKRRVTVYYFEKETVEDYSFGEEVPGGIFEGFSIKIQ